MKKILLNLIVFCSLFSVHCEAQYWVTHCGGTTIDAGISISADAHGNSYATGYFTSTATIGPNLTSAGDEDIYITKLNSGGLIQWSHRAGGPLSDRPTCIKADAAGNSYITGFYNGTANFAPFNITSSGLQDIFIAKYNTAGVCLWVKSAGGTESDAGNGITVDAFGDVIVTGQFTGSATFGSTVLTTANNSIGVFTCKLDANGNFIWAKQGSGLQTDIGVGVAADVAGNIFVTGQFSDTITFDVVHDNTQSNAAFLIKYDSSGAEQWFRIVGGGIYNQVNAITIDSLGNPFIAGDFQGVLTFFEPNGNATLTNTYPNRIFIAKYDEAGDLTWSTASGSESALTAKSIAIGYGDSPYLIGDFACRLNSYADAYGQGTFCSVGYLDIYIANWNAAGVWQWSSQIGGHLNDDGAGIAMTNTNYPVMTGSFGQDVIFPWMTAMNPTCSNVYCNDSFSRYYNITNTYGNSDIIIANGIDISRQPYDYFYRSGAGCSRDFRSVCINTMNHQCPDTITSCVILNIFADAQISTDTITCQTWPAPYGISIGPATTYLWSTGDTVNNITVTNSGYYNVTVSTVDGCFTTSDSVYVNEGGVPTPEISDNIVVNDHNIYPQNIEVCDSVLLTGSNYGNYEFFWIPPSNINGPIDDSTIVARVTGYYGFEILDTITGCSKITQIKVNVDSLFVPFVPAMMCIEDTNRTDTVSICSGGFFGMYCFDTLSNPTAILACVEYSSIHWFVSPNTITYTTITICDPYSWNEFFYPQQPGWYTITVEWVRANPCDSDTVYLSRNIYVNIYPNPVVNAQVHGDSTICPGDSIQLIATGGNNFAWHGTNINGDATSSVWINSGGYYWCAIEAINTDGCSNVGIGSITVTEAIQPNITMIPATGLICPNDSVALTTTGSGTFAWQGPGGPIPTDSSTIYVHQAGHYYCIVTNSYNCVLISNTILVTQYNTPYLVAVPDTLICPGDSVTIEIICNPLDTISWNAPYSGSSLTETTNIPGTYSCNLTGCNQTFVATIHITLGTPVAAFHADTLTGCVGFDAHFINTSTDANSYHWNFGDNTTDTAKNPFHVYNSTGTFSVTLIAILDNDCRDSITQVAYITIINNPVSAAFTASPLTGCNPMIVAFNNTSTDALTNRWFFGNGDSSTIINPTYTYSIPGTYSDTLIIANSTVCGGVIDTIIRHDYITVNVKPVASFTADTLHGCKPFIVQFNNASSNATSYLWNFGDLDTSTAINPLHTFDSAGIFSITLIAFNADGCNDTTTIPAYIQVITTPLPAPSFIANPLSGCDSIIVHFTNSSTNGTSYLWRFGDGITDTLPNPIHHYDSSGTYSITLITYSTNSCGTLVDSIIQNNYITVNKSAHAAFVADTLTGCIPFNVSFTNTSSLATGYVWAFGNGNSSTAMNPNTTYDSTGIYSVMLIALGAGGCNDTASYSYISVIKPPAVTSLFTADTTNGCTPLTVQFTNTSTNGMTYIWSFGNGDSSILKNPSYTFQDTGLYTITLISMNDTSICGPVENTLIKTDYIALANPEKITGTFSGNPMSGCIPLIVNFTNSSTNGTSYIWNFGNGQSSNAQNPTNIIYVDSGSYTVTLIAYNLNARCYNAPDTAVLQIDAKPCTFSFPNIFSPNGDGKNDVLNFIADGYSNYHLILFDRWGLKVFESTNAADLWNGTVNNSGGECPDGTYYYIFTANDGFGNPYSNHGFVSLIR